MPRIFGDNMVLQRNMPIPVWGKSNSRERVEVFFNGQQVKTTADRQGNWKIVLQAEPAGGPYELVVLSDDTIRYKNVLVGEVWVCGGQSNMEWKVSSSKDAAKEIADAKNSLIRYIRVPKEIDSEPQNDIKSGDWQICGNTTVGEFTAVGYSFARKLSEELKIPIGLINTSWGGTNIETWMSRDAMEASDEFRAEVDKYPKMTMDSLNAILVRPVVNRIKQIKGIRITPNAAPFSEIITSDEKWPEMKLPGIWEQHELGELDGVVWFRKTFELPDSLSRQSATVDLLQIEDQEITYINGVQVGSTSEWGIPRRYRIPEGVLKSGKNTIAIRITDNGGSGGIRGEASDMVLRFGKNIVPLSGNWKYQLESVKRVSAENLLPSLCFNAIINPITSFAIKGVIWYQGESNVLRAYQYRKAFPLLIADWRRKWQQGNFPFYFVQLSSFNNKGNSNEGCAWAELREAQSMALAMPNTGMCVTTDVGSPIDIHPTDKKTVGERLAAMALHNNYEKPRICSGPVFKSMRQVDEQIELSFDHVGSGLMTTDKYGYIRGFEIAGEDQVFYFAKAEIFGNKILVYSDKVKNPVAVHYGWMGDATECSVFNNDGFPLAPFRTDQWKNVTKDIKYTISVFSD